MAVPALFSVLVCRFGVCSSVFPIGYVLILLCMIPVCAYVFKLFCTPWFIACFTLTLSSALGSYNHQTVTPTFSLFSVLEKMRTGERYRGEKCPFSFSLSSLVVLQSRHGESAAFYLHGVTRCQPVPAVCPALVSSN